MKVRKNSMICLEVQEISFDEGEDNQGDFLLDLPDLKIYFLSFDDHRDSLEGELI
jgi:hypothetical protein